MSTIRISTNLFKNRYKQTFLFDVMGSKRVPKSHQYALLSKANTKFTLERTNQVPCLSTSTRDYEAFDQLHLLVHWLQNDSHSDKLKREKKNYKLTAAPVSFAISVSLANTDCTVWGLGVNPKALHNDVWFCRDCWAIIPEAWRQNDNQTWFRVNIYWQNRQWLCTRYFLL